jgi:hypothetical protein
MRFGDLEPGLAAYRADLFNFSCVRRAIRECANAETRKGESASQDRSQHIRPEFPVVAIYEPALVQRRGRATVAPTIILMK